MRTIGKRSSQCLVVFLVACVAQDQPLAPNRNLAPNAPSPEILDAVHNAGNPHFFFLPPMVPAPAFSGTADDALTATVTVCQWAGECINSVAEFNALADGDSQYHVNWKTDQCYWGPCTLDPAQTYRLTVNVGSRELGHADLRVVTSEGKAKNLQTGEYIILVDGRTLPVKFRIETGIVTALSILPNPATVPIGTNLQLTATATDLHGNPIGTPVINWSTPDASLATVTGGGLLHGVLGSCTSVGATSEGITAGAVVLVTPTPRDVVYEDRQQLYAIGADGCNPSLFTTLPGNKGATDATWSPNGSQLAFTVYDLTDANANGGPTIYVANADGSSPHSVGITAGYSGAGFSWSPNGQEIAFSGRDPGGNCPSNLWVIGADGRGERQLTTCSDQQSQVSDVRWSPIGQQIAFTRVRQRNYNVAVINSDGSAYSELTQTAWPLEAARPKWSPDAGTIAYSGQISGGAPLFTIPANGGQSRQISTGASSYSWSPDGTFFALIRAGYDGGGLQVIRSDGSGGRMLAVGSTVVDRQTLGWSKSSMTIFFVRVPGNDYELYTINLDGTAERHFVRGNLPAIRP